MNVRLAMLTVIRIFRRLRHETATIRRVPGTARGRIVVAPDFDAPLPNEAGFD